MVLYQPLHLKVLPEDGKRDKDFPARLEEIVKKSKTSPCSPEWSAFAAVKAAIHRMVCGFQ